MNSGPNQFNKGDAYTKGLRRQIHIITRKAKYYKKLALIENDEKLHFLADQLQSKVLSLEASLDIYLALMGWTKDVPENRKQDS